MKPPYDLVTIGDCVVDTFIDLKEAKVHWHDKNHEHGELSMAFGLKIPYKKYAVIPGVGNPANVAVGAARLGVKTAFLSAIGNDAAGKDILALYKKEGVGTEFIKTNPGVSTNEHFVLTYEAERTILVKHNKFSYVDPMKLSGKADWIYFSSLGEDSLPFHAKLAAYLKRNPRVRMGFNPNTYQLRFGPQKLKDIYKHTYALFVNREEAEDILKIKNPDVKVLFNGLHKLGPKVVLITDGPSGAYGSDGKNRWFMPKYPDPKPPVSRTGAGDAFSTGFMCALIYGLPVRDALRWAPIESMNVVQYFGAQTGLLSKPKLLALLKKAPKNYQPKPL